MNNVCTPTTAARLKAAGFPQPAPAPGQFWYIEGALYIVRTPVPAGRHKDFMLSRLNSGYDGWVREEYFNRYTFAPGVAELLRALGEHYVISAEQNGLFYATEVALSPRQTKPGILNENPAEALAAAWLEAHEGK